VKTRRQTSRMQTARHQRLIVSGGPELPSKGTEPEEAGRLFEKNLPEKIWAAREGGLMTVLGNRPSWERQEKKESDHTGGSPSFESTRTKEPAGFMSFVPGEKLTRRRTQEGGDGWYGRRSKNGGDHASQKTSRADERNVFSTKGSTSEKTTGTVGKIESKT